MRGVHRVEAMLDAELYEAWQEYLTYHRRTGQRELRWLIRDAVEKFYEEKAQERQSALDRTLTGVLKEEASESR